MLIPNSHNNHFDEVLSILINDSNKFNRNNINQNIWESIISERSNDYFPILYKTQPFFNLEWTHKKGKKKPQQFWIYCEENQQNYIRVTFNVPSFSWTSNSIILKVKLLDIIVFIENFSHNRDYNSNSTVTCLSCHLANNSNNSSCFTIEDYSYTDLEYISFNDFDISFNIISDNDFPIHPLQGKSDEVSINQNILQDKTIPFPFCFLGKFTFKNREEGWFRLQTSLKYKGKLILNGQSDLFMFNNPRMKKKKHLSNFTPLEIKFMQVYSLCLNKDEDYWFDIGMQLGFGNKKSFDLLLLSPQIFIKTGKKNSSTNLNLPSILIPTSNTPLQFTSNLTSNITSTSNSNSNSNIVYNQTQLTKRKRFEDLIKSVEPIKKKQMIDLQVNSRSISLPAMKTWDNNNNNNNSNNNTISTINNNNNQLYKLPKRADTGPSISSLKISKQEYFQNYNVNIPSINSLSSCPTVSTLKVPPIHISYQYLTQDMKLENSLFSYIYCSKTISIDQLILKIEQKQQDNENKQITSNTIIRHLYSICNNKVIELTDTMDLHNLFKKQVNPIILISPYDDQTTPSKILFTRTIPRFQPKKSYNK